MECGFRLQYFFDLSFNPCGYRHGRRIPSGPVWTTGCGAVRSCHSCRRSFFYQPITESLAISGGLRGSWADQGLPCWHLFPTRHFCPNGLSAKGDLLWVRHGRDRHWDARNGSVFTKNNIHIRVAKRLSCACGHGAFRGGSVKSHLGREKVPNPSISIRTGILRVQPSRNIKQPGPWKMVIIDQKWAGIDWDLKKAFRTFRFWFLIAAFFFISFAFQGVLLHAVAAMVDAKMSRSIAAFFFRSGRHRGLCGKNSFRKSFRHPWEENALNSLPTPSQLWASVA